MNKSTDSDLSSSSKQSLIYRQITAIDGPQLWAVAKSTQVLDLNSVYFYTLLATLFPQCGHVCIDRDLDCIVGFCIGLSYQKKIGEILENILFIWQIGVRPSHHKQRIASNLLNNLVENSSFNYIETTITPSNKASQGLFLSFSKQQDIKIIKSEIGYIPAEGLFKFGERDSEQHEIEDLYLLGPFLKS